MATPTLTCKVIKPAETYQGKQALTYFSGISAETTGAQGICMHMLTIAPGQRARAGMWYGENLKEHLTVKAGEYLYIPAGMPHLPYNPSETETAIGILARTDPNEQESVVLVPEPEDS